MITASVSSYQEGKIKQLEIELEQEKIKIMGKKQTKKLGTIKITDFALRHFDKNFGGTKILKMDPKDFENSLNEFANLYFDRPDKNKDVDDVFIDILDGYAPFCKLLVTTNMTDAKTGTLPITLENYQYLRSGYSARRKTEFSVLSRWLDLPLGKPKAKYIISVLYSKEQIDKESIAEYKKKLTKDVNIKSPELFDGDWGLVAILGQMNQEEEPMKPMTMMRNYMHISMGGSGMKLPNPPLKPNLPEISELMEKYKKALMVYNDEVKEFSEKYEKSVKFWEQNATVK